jgi:putative membrane protein
MLAILLSPLGPLLQERAWEWSWHMHPMGWMWGAGGLVMMVMMLVFWAVVIVAVVVAMRWLWHQGPAGGGDGAIQILRERYARGEISREEFESRKRDLAG